MQNKNKQNMKYRTYLIAILGLTLIIGCKKEGKEITYRTQYVDTAMLTKYIFKPGTYWVYENQNSSIDSIVVTSVDNGMTIIPCPHGCPSGITSRTEFFIMNLLDVTNNLASNYYYMSNHIKLNGGGEYSQNGQPIFLYHELIGHSFNGAEILNKVDTMTVFGIKYYNITKMKISAIMQVQHEFSFDTYLYFSDNFGLIRKEINDTINGYVTWNLKRSLINH
jgi:hypothetical protein